MQSFGRVDWKAKTVEEDKGCLTQDDIDALVAIATRLGRPDLVADLIDDGEATEASQDTAAAENNPAFSNAFSPFVDEFLFRDEQAAQTDAPSPTETVEFKSRLRDPDAA